MKKTIKQIYNHKIKYPGSLSFYETKVSIGSNAHSKKELEEKLQEIMPGLSRYLYERGFLISLNGKAEPAVFERDDQENERMVNPDAQPHNKEKGQE